MLLPMLVGLSHTQRGTIYSVIQCECLAAVYGMKQYRHYLLSCAFILVTDHEPHSHWLALGDDCSGYLGSFVSYRHSRCLLVIQDYFTKWADAIPMPNETAATITTELVKIIGMFGLPDILHFDQGRNSIVQQMLNTFGIQKSRTTAYHMQGDEMVERFNQMLLQMCGCVFKIRLTGNAICHLYFSPIAQQSIQQGSLPSNSCSVALLSYLHCLPSMPLTSTPTSISCAQLLLVYKIF